MKITFDQYNDFINYANEWIKANPKESPFKYALEKVLKKIGKLNSEKQLELTEIITDLETDYAYVINNKTKAYELDEKGRKMQTPDTLKLYNKKKREAEKSFNDNIRKEGMCIDGYIATQIPDDLTTSQKEAFSGLVIPELKPAAAIEEKAATTEEKKE